MPPDPAPPDLATSARIVPARIVPDRVVADFLRRIADAADPEALEAVRVAALGRKGVLTAGMKQLKALPVSARRQAGQHLNAARTRIAAALEAHGAKLETEALNRRLGREAVDITLDPPPRPEGKLHPVSQTVEECIAIFGAMGFTVAEGPDIEDEFHNFTALNMPQAHPARQMMDTFYLEPPCLQPSAGATDEAPPARLLRTHTSPVQIRTMLGGAPPIRIVAPGRAFRCDHDATHTPMFHQIEALVVDESTHLGHLKGCITDFLRTFFAIPDLPVRFRPSHFPFTEPSMEVDIGCDRSGGALRPGVGSDWLEIMGSGMVHPAVLRHGGIDPDRYQGFAFGMGIDRIAMLKYGIPDLRTFFDADIRWLDHFGFGPLDMPSLANGL